VPNPGRCAGTAMVPEQPPYETEQGDALFLWNAPCWSGRQPLVLNTDGETLLSMGDMRPSLAIGPRLVVDFSLCPDRAWEGVYFGTHNWQRTQTVVGENDLRLPGDLGLAMYDQLQADRIDVSYSADFHNAEANRWWHGERWSWLAGFRYIHLSEDFAIHGMDLDTDPAVGGSDYRVSTENNLFGGQAGARLADYSGRIGWDMTGKLGLFGNVASQRTFVGDNDNVYVFRDFQSHRGGVAFVCDLSLSASWQMTDVWWVRGGYNLIWIQGLALAGGQLDFTDYIPDPEDSGGAISTSDGVVLHGLHVGLEARW